MASDNFLDDHLMSFMEVQESRRKAEPQSSITADVDHIDLSDAMSLFT